MEKLLQLTYIEIALVALALLIPTILLVVFLTRKKQNQTILEPVALEPVQPTITFADRLKKGLASSRSQVWGKIETIFKSDKFDDDSIEQIEEILYLADLGPTLVAELMAELKLVSKKLSDKMEMEQFKNTLFNFMKNKMIVHQQKIDSSLYSFNPNSNYVGPKVIMIVGVNGAGKTTTIGKLATKLKKQGATVIVGACDTFRAAAVDQLEIWCKRAGAEMVRANEGSNPTGVAYSALEKAIKEKADYCILDTAGRLHTKTNLMEELAKTKKVLAKLDNNAPHQTLLVIDAITGQNALKQAEEFHKTLTISGLIFTKCDSSSKAGSAVSIVEKLGVPISYIGVGESVEDLDVFNLDDYLNALLRT